MALRRQVSGDSGQKSAATNQKSTPTPPTPTEKPKSKACTIM